VIDAVPLADLGEDVILFALTVWWNQNADGLADQFGARVSEESFRGTVTDWTMPSRFLEMIASSEDSTIAARYASGAASGSVPECP
jgi:hypothetical protein